MENVKAAVDANNISFDDFDLELKTYAKEHKVPIILDSGLAFLEKIIKDNNPKKILEIGTAIGYSSIRMAKASDAIIYTIERNEEMYNLAINNIKRANLENRINVIYKDALLAYDDIKDNIFDIIFIDAAKAQYKKFFDIYSKSLSPSGIIVCDNMLFHGLVEKDISTYSRSVRGLIRKLKDFHEYLFNNKDYDTKLYDIGDGISVSKKI